MGRDVRKGTNESWFRELNERLELRAAARTSIEQRFEVVCECAREECTERIELSFSEYQAVRRDPKDFVVVPGHADSTCEQVVSAAGGYDVVRKFGDAGMVAEVQNPRNGNN